MHIPSYQIHNVLNVYRKQLSQGQGNTRANPFTPHPPQNRINISFDDQRQSIIDRISSEIVDRIAQDGPETRFGPVLADRLSRSVTERNGIEGQRDTEFSYTVIDEHNRKVTNTMPVKNLSLLAPLSGAADGSKIEDKFTLKEK